jgi:DNA-binding transcriptional ArsR family regulator
VPRKPPARQVQRLTDPRALRALAHPIRLELVGLLRLRGPLTATRAAELIGESSGSTSFHLRQLAKYGLVEEAGGGKGRERPWRATAMFTGWPDVADSPELAAASGLLGGVIAEKYFEWLMRWLDQRDREPAEWQEAAGFGDTVVWVTAEELSELGRQQDALTDRFLERWTKPEARPPGARPIALVQIAVPVEGADGEPSSGGRRR